MLCLCPILCKRKLLTQRLTAKYLPSPQLGGTSGVYNVYTCTAGTLALNVQLSRVSQCTYQSVQTVQTSPEPLPETGSRPIRSVKKIDIRTNWLTDWPTHPQLRSLYVDGYEEGWTVFFGFCILEITWNSLQTTLKPSKHPWNTKENIWKNPWNVLEIWRNMSRQIISYLAEHVPPNNFLFGGTVPPNRKLFGGTPYPLIYILVCSFAPPGPRHHPSYIRRCSNHTLQLS